MLRIFSLTPRPLRDSRDVHDVVHKVAAVGSRSVEKAQQFIDTIAGGDKSIKAYGTYDEVYVDKVQLIELLTSGMLIPRQGCGRHLYRSVIRLVGTVPKDNLITIAYLIAGTPHTYHYENALAAIKAKKHVLCEKPVTSNAAELRSLLAAAKEYNVFFMEAMWTRFQPLTLEVKKIIEEGSLGAPVVLHADLSGDFDIYNIPKTHRILDPALGGGAILDLGPYPLIWAIVALYENPLNKLSRFTNISASMLKTPLTNVDQNTSFTVTFAGADLAAQAILSCSINLNAQSPGVNIRFERGTIEIPAPIYCPKEYKVTYTGKGGEIVKEERKVFEYVGGGWHFQADEVARCVRDGKKESTLWGHNKSLLEMEIFDEVKLDFQCIFLIPTAQTCST
ncbi:hypothetical protein C0995_008489 [Termitomyces sp. Mi166|nr:hypothetical protein C0995_008489 [Termitomyces sp. Mi166\